MTLHVSRFMHRGDNEPKPVDMEWLDLVHALTSFKIRDKPDGELWSPVRYLEGSSRGSDNVLDVWLAVLDIDDGEDPEKYRVQWDKLGLEYVIHSTWHNEIPKKLKSTTKPAHKRWRAVFPLQRPVLATKWSRTYARIAEYLAPGAWDISCKDPSRLFWLPAAPNESTTFSEHVPGRLLDPDEAPELESEKVDTSKPSEEQDKDRLHDALSHIPSDDYDTWLRVGMALKYCLGEDGLECWDKWSQGAENYEEDAVSKKWATFKNDKGNKVTSSTIYHLAMQGGWKPPLVAIPGNNEKSQDTSIDARLAKLLRTESDNAERLFQRYGDSIRYLSQSKRWLVWDGARWEDDGSGRIFEAAKASNRLILKEAHTLEDDQVTAHTKWAINSLSASNIRNTISMCQSLVPVSAELLDSENMLLNVRSGTIDLATGQQQRHNRADMITKLTGIKYDPGSSCPIWEKFLNTITDGDIELQSFLQRSVGYTMTGDTSEQCLFLCYGTGANGKSVFLSTIQHMMGEYARQADFNTFLEIKTDGPRNDLARLHGARLVTAVEPDPGKPLAESVVKSLTGDDMITARFLYAENFSFRPTFKIWLAANHKPQIKGQDEGIWRRIRLIPFAVRIAKADMDKHLTRKLKAEMPGILSWAIDGCLDWKKNGLRAPECVVDAGEKYREEENILCDFLSAQCVSKSHIETSASKLYSAYSEHCKGNGTYQHSQKKFGGTLTSLGYHREKRGGKMYWSGIGIRNDSYENQDD